MRCRNLGLESMSAISNLEYLYDLNLSFNAKTPLVSDKSLKILSSSKSLRKSLRSLNLEHCRNVTGEGFAHIEKFGDNLTSLITPDLRNYNFFDLYNLIKSLKNVVSLKIHSKSYFFNQYSMDTGDALQSMILNVIANLPSLTSLDLPGLHDVVFYSKDIKNKIDALVKRKYFGKNEILQYKIPKSNKIVHLTLRKPKINSCKEKYFLESVNYCQNLKSFKLVNNSEIEKKSRALFFSNLFLVLKPKDIYTIDLRGSTSSSDYSPEVLQNLTKMTSLKILKIDFALSYYDLNLLCKSLNNLEELSIKFSSFKEKSLFIPPILLTLKKLKTLQIQLTVREKDNYESRLIYSLLKRLYFSGVVIEFYQYHPTLGSVHYTSINDLLLS
jgi:hypothetical protein